jgi:uncharacterized protein YyaL (SSP411 family)
MFLRIASIALHVLSRACNYPEKWSSNQRGTTSCKPKSTQAPANASTTGRAYGQSHTPEYLAAAQNVHRFVRTFLTSPDGAFYVSQDADVISGRHSPFFFSLSDEMRRAIRIPRIDKHLYARENGWMINAVARLYAVTGRSFHACRGRALGALGHHSSQSRWRRLCTTGSDFRFSLPAKGRRFRHNDQEIASYTDQR